MLIRQTCDLGRAGENERGCRAPRSLISGRYLLRLLEKKTGRYTRLKAGIDLDETQVHEHESFETSL